MKILVISDTHGFLSNAKEAIRKNKDIKMVIHLGDYIRDAIELSKLFPDIHFEYVLGNCDMNSGNYEGEKILEIDGKRIFITHGHKYSVKWDYNRIMYKAQEVQADAVLFGHTHISLIDWAGSLLIVNPGSISESRSQLNESYAVLTVDGNGIDADLVHF